MIDTGVVDQHVDAVEAADGKVDQRLAIGHATDVDLQRLDCIAQLRGEALEARRVLVAEHEVRTLRSKAPRRALTDARGGTGDDDDLAGEPIAVHALAACSAWRPSATSSISFAQKAGRSSGLRLVTRPLSTTTS